MPAIDIAHLRLVLSGSMPGGEVWSTGVATLPQTGTATAIAAASIAKASFPNFLNQLTAMNGLGFTVAKLTCYHYPAGSRAADDVGSAAIASASTGTPTTPNQTAVVATLRTNINTGRGRGRLFLPATKLIMGSAGLYTTPTTTAIAGVLATWLGDVDAVVASEAAGNTAIVTSVTIDNRPDVIRARAEKLTPTSSSAVVTVIP